MSNVRRTCKLGSFECDYSGVNDYENPELSCDSIDNDCDTETDEELVSATAPLWCTNQGQCATGVVGTCGSNGAAECNYTYVPFGEFPDETSCDGRDNDCDCPGDTNGDGIVCGIGDENVDEDLISAEGSTCRQEGVCETGVLAECIEQVDFSMGWICDYSQITTYEEDEFSCDGFDNDCDGETDENLTDVAASDCDTKGVCSVGLTAICVSGVWMCDYTNVIGYQGNYETLCDGKDNDCDTFVDELSCEPGRPCSEDFQCSSSQCKQAFQDGPRFCIDDLEHCLTPLSNGTASVVPTGGAGCYGEGQQATCSNGLWAPDNLCPNDAPRCVQGACLVCVPDEEFCGGNTDTTGNFTQVKQCYDDGSGSLTKSSCNPKACMTDNYCVEGGELHGPQGAGQSGSACCSKNAQRNAQLLAFPKYNTTGTLITGEYIALVWETMGHTIDNGFGLDNSGFGVASRIFEDDGDPVAGILSNEVINNTQRDGDQRYPVAAVNNDNEVMYVWQSYGGGDDGVESPNSDGIAAIVYKDGFPTTPEDFTVNVWTSGKQQHPSVTATTDGNFAIVWEDFSDISTLSQDGSSEGVIIRVINSSGEEIGPEIIVNTHTQKGQKDPHVISLGDGNLFVSWISLQQDQPNSVDYGVYGQLMSKVGLPTGNEIHLNQELYGDQKDINCAAISESTFMCAWTSIVQGLPTLGQDGNKGGIFGRLFANDGTPMADEFQINLISEQDQQRPDIFALADGDFGVAWQGELDNDGWGVYARIFDTYGVPKTTDLQLNFLENFDQTSVDCVGLQRGHFVCAWTSYFGDAGGNDAVKFRFFDH